MIETERLVLRQWRDEDRAPFAALNADPDVMEFFPATLDRAQSDAMVDRMSAGIEQRGWGLWAVDRDGELLGFTGLAVPGFETPFLPAVEIGWRFARSAWGHGYATEAARAAVAHAFDVLELDGLVSFTAQQNLRSRAVMERLGMTHVPADDFDHPALAEGHPLRRHVLYRLARS